MTLALTYDSRVGIPLAQRWRRVRQDLAAGGGAFASSHG